MLTRRELWYASLAVFLAGNALAETHEPVVLTVSRPGESVDFTLSELKALDHETIETTTIWSEGVQTFTGVPLRSLMQALGISGGLLVARAINDYAVEIPVSDGVENGPILAYELNGVAMSVRDKGPLWLVYPYDHNPEYRTEVIYSRSIWQLDRIEVLP